MTHNHKCYIYILSNKHRTVYYVGFTNNLKARLWEHKNKLSKFTANYNCHDLLYYEEYQYAATAIAREKQLKKWRRSWKIDLIKKTNPNMDDLSKDWFSIP